MKGLTKVNQELIEENALLSQRVKELEKSELERKQTEGVQLWESEVQLKEIIDKNPISMAIVCMDGTIEYINRRAVETFGYELTDIPDMEHWWELAYPDETYRAGVIGQWMGLVEKAIAQHSEIEKREYRVTCKNGIIKTVIVFGILIGNKLFVMFEDITDRKRAEEDLLASNHLFSLFMSHSPIYTFIKEVTPTQSLVLQASDNFLQIIGIPGYEMIGKTMAELFPPEFAAKITADDWAVVSKGEVLRLDEELNGRSYETIKFPIVLGEKTLLAGYTIDNTALKRRDEELMVKTTNLEEVNAALSVLIKQVEEGKRDLEGKILSNIRELVLPYLSRLQNTPLSDIQKAILQTADSNLNNITSTFLTSLRMKYYNLTPRETEVATFVREGRSVKEIAALLCLSKKTVELHRGSLREKLGLRNKKINLRSYLINIQ